MNAEHWQKIKSLFDAAVELDDAKRAKFLVNACTGDDELRLEVQKMLDSFEGSESFLEAPAAEAVADLILDSDAKLVAGQTIGHYEIVRPLGVGGMGEVYLARDDKLDRSVAVKILNGKFSAHDSNLERFTREAKAASALNHPNILVIHEIGVTDKTNYIISEYITGKTLRDVFKESPLSISEIIDIAVQIAGALAAAHGEHIIHRDIKPENIMVRPDGYVKVLDFGLAKLIGGENSLFGLEDVTKIQNQTAQGVIMGTVNYMSPEQAKGEKVDERTDIFSLGVLIYEMVSGRTPFEGDSISETFADLIKTEPQPLSRYVGNVPDELQRIVTKTLRKKKDDRYQTMKDVLSDLKSLHKRLDFEAEFDSGKYSKNFSNKSKAYQGEVQNSIAVLPFVNMSADAENEYFCDGLAEELSNALAKIENLNVAARTSAFSFKGKDVNVSEIGRILNVETVVEGSVRRSDPRVRITVQLIKASNGYHLWSERYDREAKDIFDIQDEIAMAVVAALKIKLLGEEKAAVLKRYTDNPDAYELYLKGVHYRWKLAPEEFRKCGAYFHQAVDADPTFALAYFGLASYYGYGTAWGLLTISPEEGWEKAEAAMQKVIELDATLPEALIENAMRLVHYREWNEAGRGIKEAARLNPKFAEIHHLYGFYLVVIGQFNEGIVEAEKALKLDPLSVNYSRFLGICYLFSRSYDKAIQQFRNALELDPNNASLHEFLGGALIQNGMFDEAVVEWQRAMTLEGDDELATVLSSAAKKSGFGPAVGAVAQKRIERLNAKVASGEFVLAINFARAYVMLGDEDQAFHWLEKAAGERNVFPLLFDGDPFYDSIRSDPRFEELLLGVGSPSHASQNTGEASSRSPRTKSTSGYESRPQTQRTLLAANFKRKKYTLISGVVIVLLAFLSGGYYFLSTKNAALGPNAKKSLAVLPFVNASQDPNAEYLSDGITESVINNLSQLSGLRVMSRNSAFRFKNNQIDTKNIASQLGVESLVTGDIKQLGDKLVINVRLIDASDDSQIWGNQYVKSSADIIAAQNEIAQAVASNLRVKLSTSEQQQLAKRPTENVESWQLYQRGRFHVFKLTPPEIQEGISYFQQAIEIDPTYARAYVGLSEAHRSLVLSAEMLPTEVLPKSQAAARKAIELDDNLSEAHTALAATLFWEWKWNEAENQFKRALELNPNSVDAHIFYAHLLSNTGRHTEAIAEAKRARELDPLFPFINALEAQFLLHAGQTDEALARSQKIFELAPAFWMPHVFASGAYIEKRMYAEAIAEARKARELSPLQTSSVLLEGYALAKAGRRDEAQALLNELLKLSTTRFVSPYHIAMIYNGLGETGKTLEWLEKGYEQHDPKMAFLKVEPKWNNLRTEPRFVELMRKMNFE